MAIQEVEDRVGMPVLGKIRLGIKKQAKSGNEYPVSVPHFVLRDAPDVAKQYGETPTELDVIFLSDNEEEVIPYYYKLFAGGSKDKAGNTVGGKLMCKGDGREADHFAARDAISRVVPKRECKVKDCVDWGRGCKQMMNVMVWIPTASMGGVYQIDTSSWSSIHSFVKQIKFIKKALNGRLTGVPFRIVREAMKTTFVDPKTGKEKSGTQYIMLLKDNPNFWERCGDQVKDRISHLVSGGDKILGLDTMKIAPPIEEGYPALEDQAQLESSVSEARVQASTNVLEDKKILALFEKLTSLKGVTNTPKIRLLTARKFEGQADQEAALTSYLEAEIGKLGEPVTPKSSAKKSSTKETTPQAPPPQKKTTAPSVEGSLI